MPVNRGPFKANDINADNRITASDLLAVDDQGRQRQRHRRRRVDRPVDQGANAYVDDIVGRDFWNNDNDSRPGRRRQPRHARDGHRRRARPTTRSASPGPRASHRHAHPLLFPAVNLDQHDRFQLVPLRRRQRREDRLDQLQRRSVLDRPRRDLRRPACNTCTTAACCTSTPRATTQQQSVASTVGTVVFSS